MTTRPKKKIPPAAAPREAVRHAAAASVAVPKTVAAAGGGPRALDRTDQSLLRLLQADGRMTNLELAAAVHLSPPACHERVKRLHRDGFIRRYAALLDAHAVGAGMLVFATVSLDRTTPDVFERFRASVQCFPEILEAHLVAGGFDYLLKIRVRDMRAYRDLIARGVWSIAGVRETHTYVVMEEVKETTEVAL